MRGPPSDYLKRRWGRQARIFEVFKRRPERDDAEKQIPREAGAEESRPNPEGTRGKGGDG